LPSQSLKSDLEEGPASAGPHKTDEQGDGAALANGTTGAASRCVNGIFAGHGKLKRLLGTLVQFATDISADTGDTVRTLVLALLVSKLASRGSARSPSSTVRHFRMSPRGNNNLQKFLSRFVQSSVLVLISANLHFVATLSRSVGNHPISVSSLRQPGTFSRDVKSFRACEFFRYRQ
jgi:hypothetical protein